MTELPSRVQELLKNNETFSQNYAGAPRMEQMRAWARSGGQGALILTCLDPRCVPEQYFGPDLRSGVIRNAGGRASPDVLRSVVALRTLVDASILIVVHHTDCGFTHMTQEEIVKEAKERTPEASADIDAIGDFGLFTEAQYEDAIKADVLKLRAEKAFGGMQILGFSMDTFSGQVKQLDI